MKIRKAMAEDSEKIWAILEPVLRSGETYSLPVDISRIKALEYWLADTHNVYVAEENDEILGTYILRANQQGGGNHVCNCGFMTSVAAQGKGIARAMLDHALRAAKTAGYLAMQFNFVIATNTRAVALWQRYGFETVGRLPHAFRHPTQGFVDVLVMYKTL